MITKTIRTLDAEWIRSCRYGVIETIDGRLAAVHFRPWPKLVSLVDVIWLGPRYHARTSGNRCLLYYNQPWRFPNFLALTYMVSTRDCTLATARAGLAALEAIARLKGTDAILCDAWNLRISDRLLSRWGWEPHTRSRWHRNFIRRFYGSYSSASNQVVGEFAGVQRV